jgi:hypothetical protein
MTSYNAVIFMRDGTEEFVKNISSHECKGEFISFYKKSKDGKPEYSVTIYCARAIIKAAIIPVEP